MISIVIPVYNVALYLQRCIESVLLQTYPDWELLLVDDGSTDNSCIICEKYKEKDKRIQVFHKKNGGVSSARNYGLNHAKGEWIAFVDSDDWLDKDYLWNFVEQIEADTDLVVQSFWNDWESSKKEMLIELPSQRIEGNYNLVRWLEDTPNVHNGFLWHRLFKREIIERQQNTFAEGISFAEDGLFFLQYLKGSHHFKMTSKAGYHYLIRKGSLTSKGKTTPLRIHERVLRGYLSSLFDFDIPIKYKKEHINFSKRYSWRLAESWFLLRSTRNKDEREECFRILRSICEDYKLYEINNIPFLLRCLIWISKLKPSAYRDILLRSVLVMRDYMNKIKRRL